MHWVCHTAPILVFLTIMSPLSTALRTRVAVIGASVSGSSFIREILRSGSVDVTVLERASRPGGRCSTRIIDDLARFDHGATYVKAKSKQFEVVLDELEKKGHVEKWVMNGATYDCNSNEYQAKPAATVRIGTKGMSSIVEGMLASSPSVDIQFRYGIEVIDAMREERVWRIKDRDGKLEDGLVFDWIVCADRGLSEKLRGEVVEPEDLFLPSLAVMVTFDAKTSEMLAASLDCQTLFVQNSKELAYVCENSAKPGRQGASALSKQMVLQSTADYAQELISEVRAKVDPEDERAILEAVRRDSEKPLLDAFAKVVGGISGSDTVNLEHTFIQGHRWSRSFPNPAKTVANGRCLVDADIGLISVGDYFAECYPGKVEGAALSGAAGAVELLRQI